MKTIIENGKIVNEGKQQEASIIIIDDRIVDIVSHQEASRQICDQRVDVAGCYVIPGGVDSHVHFREPGLTHKATIASESREAALGGVTTYFDMPNTIPQTTSLEQLQWKEQRAAEVSSVNYAFFIGATNDNVDEIVNIDTSLIPGIKLFMGSSTGNMLVDRKEIIEKLFEKTSVPIVAHCEDTAIINRNMKRAEEQFGGEPPIECHSFIRSSEACVKSTALAIELAKNTNAHLHIAHISTEEELELIRQTQIDSSLNSACRVTAEAVIAHLWFEYKDFKRLGAKIKCNPSIKEVSNRNALRKALTNNVISTVATDHAPHTIAEKQGGAKTAASGMPMIRYSLQSMMQLVEEKVLTIERLVELMCHNPAKLFDVSCRGYILPRYKADIAIIKKDPITISQDNMTCCYGWSPMEGTTFDWRVIHTFCNGHHIVDNQQLKEKVVGEKIVFRQ